MNPVSLTDLLRDISPVPIWDGLYAPAAWSLGQMDISSGFSVIEKMDFDSGSAHLREEREYSRHF